LGISRNSIFAEFVEEGIDYLEAAEDIERNLTRKGKENIKISHLASSAERFSKALLSIYGLTVVFPLFIFNKLEDLMDKQELVMKIGELLRKIVLTSFDEEELKRLGHKPISQSELKELMYYTEKLLPKELRRVYARIINYMKLNPKMRTFEYLKNIMDEVNMTFISFKLENNPEESTIRNLKKDPVEIRDLVVTFTIVFNDVLEKILYMLYLEHAAGGVARYRVGRDEADERYLSNVREYQKQILEFLRREGTTLEGLASNPEFNYELNEIRIMFEDFP